MTSLLHFATLTLILCTVAADIVLTSDRIDAKDSYKLKYALQSRVPSTISNTTKYYCVFRSLWNSDDHPRDFPENAVAASPILMSHTKEFSPFVKNRTVNAGMMKLAEVRVNRRKKQVVDNCTRRSHG